MYRGSRSISSINCKISIINQLGSCTTTIGTSGSITLSVQQRAIRGNLHRFTSRRRPLKIKSDRNVLTTGWCCINNQLLVSFDINLPKDAVKISDSSSRSISNTTVSWSNRITCYNYGRRKRVWGFAFFYSLIRLANAKVGGSVNNCWRNWRGRQYGGRRRWIYINIINCHYRYAITNCIASNGVIDTSLSSACYAVPRIVTNTDNSRLRGDAIAIDIHFWGDQIDVGPDGGNCRGTEDTDAQVGKQLIMAMDAIWTMKGPPTGLGNHLKLLCNGCPGNFCSVVIKHLPENS